MNKYIFQNGGEETSFFNQMADMMISAKQQEDAYTGSQEAMPEQAPDEYDELTKQVEAYEQETAEQKDAKMLAEFNMQLEMLQGKMDMQIQEMEQQMIALAAMASDDGEEYSTRMFDTNDDEVDYIPGAAGNIDPVNIFDKSSNKAPSPASPAAPSNVNTNEILFKSSGEQGLNNIGPKGLEIGNTVTQMLGYTPTFNSIYRTSGQQKKLIEQGYGAKNSYHLTGNAIDMKPKDWNNLTKEQQKELRSKYDVVYHNNHYHLEPK